MSTTNQEMALANDSSSPVNSVTHDITKETKESSHVEKLEENETTLKEEESVERESSSKEEGKVEKDSSLNEEQESIITVSKETASNETLNKVISAIQDSVTANIPEKQNPIDFSQEVNSNTPEDSTVAEIHAISEPESPRPSMSEIAQHFEQVRRVSIDVDKLPTPSASENILKTPNTTRKLERSPTNQITLNMIVYDTVKPNFLSPRAQEKFGKGLNCEGKGVYG